MIIKKFFGKTIEIARKSARQMYGDDIVVLESFQSDGTHDAGVTVLVDVPHNGTKPNEQETTPFRNVFYQRRDVQSPKGQRTGFPPQEEKHSVPAEPSADAPKKIGNNLEALRRFALHDAQSVAGRQASPRPGAKASLQSRHNNAPEYRNEDPPQHGQPGESSYRNEDPPQHGQPGESSYRNEDALQRGQEDTPPFENQDPYQLWQEPSREHNRDDASPFGKKGPPLSNGAAKFNTQDRPHQQTLNPSKPLRKRFNPGIIDYPSPRNHAGNERENLKDIAALQKRFDRLEKLLGSALISSNLDMAAHPAFQQLVKTGIKPVVVARWFREIMDAGVDPDEHPEPFLNRLSEIIRSALKTPENHQPAKFLLFTGPSASGKTSLVMKLLQHPDFFSGKRLAAATLLPPDDQTHPYYTILEPFCRDHNIPFYSLPHSDHLEDYLQEWESFDHVLLDSPSIPVEKELSFRKYWNMRQRLISANPLEVHYVVNVAMNRFYFKDSGALHHPLQPDFVALTHLDETAQWGPVIPFMEVMGCGSRFVSMGTSIPDDLSEFNPAWFAQQILQDT